MKFQPKTDKEIAEEKLLPEGIYDFTISNSEHYVSKSSGKESIKILVRVFKPDGNFMLVDAYLSPNYIKLLKHACDACGLSVAYEMGELNAEDFIGKSGKLKLKIQKDKTGDYSDKNVIDDFVVDKDKATAPKPMPVSKSVKAAEVIDDEIPWN